MSIIACPQCGKRTSSLSPICDHCGLQSGEAGEGDVQRYQKRKLRRRIYHLNMATYAIMTVVIAAFGWYWVATKSMQEPTTSHGPYYLMMAAAVAYLVVRVLLFRAKRERKALRREH